MRKKRKWVLCYDQLTCFDNGFNNEYSGFRMTTLASEVIVNCVVFTLITLTCAILTVIRIKKMGNKKMECQYVRNS